MKQKCPGPNLSVIARVTSKILGVSFRLLSIFVIVSSYYTNVSFTLLWSPAPMFSEALFLLLFPYEIEFVIERLVCYLLFSDYIDYLTVALNVGEFSILHMLFLKVLEKLTIIVSESLTPWLYKEFLFFNLFKIDIWNSRHTQVGHTTLQSFLFFEVNIHLLRFLLKLSFLPLTLAFLHAWEISIM